MSEARPHSRLWRAHGIRHRILTGNVKVTVVAWAVVPCGADTGAVGPAPSVPSPPLMAALSSKPPAHTEGARGVFLPPLEPHWLPPHLCSRPSAPGELSGASDQRFGDPFRSPVAFLKV